MQVVQEKIRTVDGNLAIKRYVVIEKVGQGAFSQCFRVQVLGSDQIFAMKIITKESMKLLEKEKLGKSLLKAVEEIRIHQTLSHPNIVFLDHWFEDKSYQYIFLEFCAKKTLEQRCKKYDSLDERHIRRYGLQILSALKYLHSKLVLHREYVLCQHSLKLANFFVDANDNIKLGDFGFACKLQASTDRKRQACGTPNFTAPEVISSIGYDGSADLWSFGVILYRMKYGVCPFEMPELRDTLRKIRDVEYAFPRWTSISSQLLDLIKKLLVADPEARPTIQQMEQHPFFKKQEGREKSLGGSIRGLVNRLFSTDKNDDRQRKDSCESRKDIKNILKEKTGETPTNKNVNRQETSVLPRTNTSVFEELGSKTDRPRSPKRSLSSNKQRLLNLIKKNKGNDEGDEQGARTDRSSRKRSPPSRNPTLKLADPTRIEREMASRHAPSQTEAKPIGALPESSLTLPPTQTRVPVPQLQLGLLKPAVNPTSLPNAPDSNRANTQVTPNPQSNPPSPLLTNFLDKLQTAPRPNPEISLEGVTKPSGVSDLPRGIFSGNPISLTSNPIGIQNQTSFTNPAPTNLVNPLGTSSARKLTSNEALLARLQAARHRETSFQVDGPRVVTQPLQKDLDMSFKPSQIQQSDGQSVMSSASKSEEVTAKRPDYTFGAEQFSLGSELQPNTQRSYKQQCVAKLEEGSTATNEEPSRLSENPLDRMLRLKNKGKQQPTLKVPPTNSILNLYPFYLVYQVQVINDHCVVYLTNGMRQIIKGKDVYTVFQPGMIFDRDGVELKEPPKMVDYISKEKLAEPFVPLTQSGFKSLIERKHFISKWRVVQGKMVFSLLSAMCMTTGKNGLYYLKTSQFQHLYSFRLEIMEDAEELAACRLAYEQVQKNRTQQSSRSTSRNRKLLQ